MRLGYFLREALTSSPLSTLRRGARLIARQWTARNARRAFMKRPAYRVADGPEALQRYLAPLPHDEVRAAAQRTHDAIEYFLDHRFDLLGSGWCDAGYGAQAPGLEEHVYGAMGPSRTPTTFDAFETRAVDRARAQALWSLVDHDYAPIDWQRDLRSGYRWSALTPGWAVRYGDQLGADIKMPWELGRCHHLLAYAVTHAATSDDAFKATLRGDFKNTVVDFLATNPPGFGAQWACAMDVSIRVVNWLVAWDIFRAHGADFGKAFEAAFANAVAEHATFILENLEWNPHLRGNHYLCDLVGLVFCGSYMAPSALADRCLAYGYEMLMREILLQFHDTGANFEASTSYHRLSTEAALYALALLQRVGGERIATAYVEQHENLTDLPGVGGWDHLRELDGAMDRVIPESVMRRMIEACAFSKAVSQPDGRDPQVGDNDNGRLLKIDVAYLAHEDGTPREDVSNHGHLRSAFAGAGLGGACLVVDEEWLDRTVMRAYLADERLLEGMLDEASSPSYAGFERPGFYVHRGASVWALMRCGDNGQNDFGGHCHNDQLSFVAWFGGQPFFVDPGTYVYTPLPQYRQLFRSTAMHNTLSLTGREQNRAASDSLFRLFDDAHGRIADADAHAFEGAHVGFGDEHRRRIVFADDGLSVTDSCESEAGDKTLWLHLHPSVSVVEHDHGVDLVNAGVTVRLRTENGDLWQVRPSQFSEAYGRVRPSQALALVMTKARVSWSVRLLSP